MVGFNAPLRGRRLQQKSLEDATWHPHHTSVLADFDAELHRLPLRIPACILGEGEEHSRSVLPQILLRVLYTFGSDGCARAPPNSISLLGPLRV